MLALLDFQMGWTISEITCESLNFAHKNEKFSFCAHAYRRINFAQLDFFGVLFSSPFFSVRSFSVYCCFRWAVNFGRASEWKRQPAQHRLPLEMPNECLAIFFSLSFLVCVYVCVRVAQSNRKVRSAKVEKIERIAVNREMLVGILFVQI